MGNLLKKDMESSLEDKIEENKKSISLMYICIFVYLLIPILSIEGIISWSIGVIGAYKTIKIYRNEGKNKGRKAIKMLIIFLAIAIMYNAIVHYATKIIISKIV